MKLNGGIFLLRIELERERGLTDPEWRLWMVYRSLCGWDKTKADFGIANITIANLQKYLDWSAGSICSTRQSLCTKGKLKKIQESKYRVVDAEKLLRPNFRQAEIGVQGIEGIVQWAENKRRRAGFSQEQKSITIPDFSWPNFQLAEFGDSSKETIKKDKEIRGEEFSLKEEDEEKPPWRDPEKTRRFRESLKRERAED
jgi:hypothetical protein